VRVTNVTDFPFVVVTLADARPAAVRLTATVRSPDAVPVSTIAAPTATAAANNDRLPLSHFAIVRARP
jgi:hypothetical protein